MKHRIALLCLPAAALLASACASGPRPLLRDPHASLDAMREASRRDDVGLFLHTLGQPVLKEYSEQTIRIGWPGIAPHVGGLVESARLVEISDYQVQPLDERVPRGFVQPAQAAKLKRVRLAADGDVEDFLFAQEIDPPPLQSRQSRGFWIGDVYYARTEHRSPQTYLIEDSPEHQRTHWRLVFPYYPFQRDGPLTRKLQERFAAEGG